MPDWCRDLAIVAAVSVVLLFTNLGRARLWDRDEPRNAGCAAEMMQRSDWVVPWFNDELRSHKPVLLYWLIPSLLEAIGAEALARLVLPDVFRRPGFAIAVMAVQAAIAVAIAVVRWRRNHGTGAPLSP